MGPAVGVPMNDPVSEPAHAVTPPEPVPVVQAAAPEPLPLTHLIDQMNTLLRMQATVDPVKRVEHDPEPGKEGRHARRRHRELPPKEWIVALFEGGRLPVPKGSSGSEYCQYVNAMFEQAKRPRADALTALLREHLMAGVTLQAGKRMYDVACERQNLVNFGLMSTTVDGQSCLVAKRVALRFDALAPAKEFADAINASLLVQVGSRVDALRAAIIARLPVL